MIIFVICMFITLIDLEPVYKKRIINLAKFIISPRPNDYYFKLVNWNEAIFFFQNDVYCAFYIRKNSSNVHSSEVNKLCDVIKQ